MPCQVDMKQKFYLLILGLREHNAVARDIAFSLDLEIVELAKLMPIGRENYGDVVHTTLRGNVIKANIVGNRVANLIVGQTGWKGQP